MDEFLGVANAVAFSALTLVVLMRWRRVRDEPAGWLAATLGTLAAALVAALFLPDEPSSTAGDLAVKVLVLLIILYPYFLYRFMASFRSPGRELDRAALAITAVMVVATLFLPRLPGEDESRPVWFQLYALGVVLQWAFLGGTVGVRLWRAGDGQPTVTRRRMRVLAVGGLLLTLAILPGAVPADQQPGVVQAITALLPPLSAVFFYIGFVPPAWLRAVWRRTETTALREVEVELMGVTTARQVADALLPHVARILGSPGALLVGGDGRPKSVHGLTEMEAMELAVPLRSLGGTEPVIVEGHPTVLALPLRDGWLAVPASAYTPFFGAEEMNLLTGLGVFTDVALERAELFERERRARREIEQANAELETLVYGVSHDLKSPIITLLGYLEYLKTDHAHALNDEGRHFLDRMGRSAEYMQALIQDLLELSRIGRVQTESSDVDLGVLVAEVSESARAGHPGLAIRADSLPVVTMNPVRARQLFTNLVENAARHGGRADLCVRINSQPEASGCTAITVADDGVGIPEEYRERVFGIFERLEARDANSTGTGMGLAICRKIVEQVDGDIRIVPSTVGAEIRLTLPLASVVPAGADKSEARR